MKKQLLILAMFFVTFAAIVMMTACTTNEAEFDLTSEQPAKQSLSDIRSYEEALQIAQNSISLLNSGEATRSSSIRKINLADSKVVMRNAGTRFSDGGSDTLMYVFNFEDNQGFAIVSASKSTEGLLAVTEKGYYDPEEGSNVESFNFFMDKARDYVAKAPKLRFPPDLPIIESRDSFAYEITTKGPFLTVEWGEVLPEGELCPNGRSGCANTAMAQVLSYYGLPTGIDINYPGADVSYQALDWTQMKAHQTGHSVGSCLTTTTHQAISRLLRQLGKMSASSYVTSSPTGGPQTYTVSEVKIPHVLDSLGYMYTNWSTYDFDNHIKYQLNALHPLILDGTSVKNGISISHNWVIDGYIISKTYHYVLVHPLGNINEWVIDSVTVTTKKLCHYNWGWYGDCNGYFASGVFDTQEPDVPTLSSEHDYDFSSGEVKVLPVYPVQ